MTTTASPGWVTSLSPRSSGSEIADPCRTTTRTLRVGRSSPTACSTLKTKETPKRHPHPDHRPAASATPIPRLRRCTIRWWTNVEASSSGAPPRKSSYLTGGPWASTSQDPGRRSGFRQSGPGFPCLHQKLISPRARISLPPRKLGESHPDKGGIVLGTRCILPSSRIDCPCFFKKNTSWEISMKKKFLNYENNLLDIL